jgi:hypothetical protein
VSVFRPLLDGGLLDEVHLFVHLATGRVRLQLFEDDSPGAALPADLVAAVRDRHGLPRYRPDPNPPTGLYDAAKESTRRRDLVLTGF